MTPLPYYVPQYDAVGIKRVVQAHVVRGLSHWLNTLDVVGTHPLNLLYVCGVHTQVEVKAGFKLPVHGASHVFKQFLEDCRPWEDTDRVRTLVGVFLTVQRYCVTPQEFEAVLAKAYYYHHCVYSRQRDQRMFDMKTDDLAKIPQDVYTRLDSTLLSLEQTLLAKDPMMPQHLRTIHSTIIAYPEAVHILKDEEIARIISGAEEMTKTKIVSDAAKKATTTRSKSLKNVSVSDL